MTVEIRCGDSFLFRDLPITSKRRILMTDPPYGIPESWARRWHGNNGRSTLRDGKTPQWDAVTVDLSRFLAWADIAVICGGNFYNLPPTPCWFIWDKMQAGRGSEAEMIWTNAPIKGVRIFRMSRIDAYVNRARWKKKHPAEKPVQLWAWILDQIGHGFILDPFMGTGSSAIAAQEAGCEYIGIEQEQQYVDEAMRRLEESRRG